MATIRIDGGTDNDRVFGGNGANSLIGNDGNDSVEGNNGDDRLFGGAGTDLLYGGNDNDSLDGGSGTDLLYGGSGNDTLTGGTENDTLYGEANVDSLDGGSGADILYGGDAGDVLRGGAGNDSLFGEAGADQLFGDADNDTLVGGAAADTMTGGIGDDVFIVNIATEGYGDVIDGSENAGDFDRLDLTGSGPLRVVYNPGNPESGVVNFLNASKVVIGTLTFQNIENVVPCFTPGTLIATARGDVAVEKLAVGDLVLHTGRGLATAALDRAAAADGAAPRDAA